MSNLRLSYLQKVGGGMFVQAIPPTQSRVGGGEHTVPPSPRDLRQWIRAINIHKQLTCLRVVDVNMRTHLTLSLFNKLIINVTQRHD